MTGSAMVLSLFLFFFPSFSLVALLRLVSFAGFLFFFLYYIFLFFIMNFILYDKESNPLNKV